jgi:tetratricopeptide (TPR) repeat protein
MEYWEAEAKAEDSYAKGDYLTSLTYYDQALRIISNDSSRRCAVISLYLGKARAYLRLGEERKAYCTLEELAQDDHQGIYLGYSEYYDVLMECQRRMGMDPKNAENQQAELNLDWRRALTRARDLLDQGKYEESLIYLERSLNSNPGEWYSIEDVYRAYRGKAEALSKLGRNREAEELLKKIPLQR